MQAETVKMSEMTEAKLKRLIALSRRKPYSEASLLWTMVWGALFAGVWLIDASVVFSGTLARVGVVLVATGGAAVILCWAFAKWMQSRVDRAVETLKSLSQEVMEH